MFATTGTVLKIQKLSQNQIETMSAYSLPKSLRHSKITSMSWSYDNSYIALVQEGCQPYILDVKNKQHISLIHTVHLVRNVTALSFRNTTKKYMVLGTASGEVHLYDAKNRTVLKALGKLDAAVKMLEFSARDTYLAVATENEMQIYMGYDGFTEYIRETVLPPCATLKFHPTIDTLIAYGTIYGHVIMKDLEKNEEACTPQKHSKRITAIAFTADKNLMVTAGLDKKICIFNLPTNECLFRMNVHKAVTALDISGDNAYLLVGLEDGCIYIYNVSDPLKPTICSNVHNSAIQKIMFENMCIFTDKLKQDVTEKNSGTTLNGSVEYDDPSGEPTVNGDSYNKCYEGSETCRTEERLQKEMFRILKNHMTYLEKKLVEHCSKFQEFMDSEFNSLHNALTRWEVFDIGEALQQTPPAVDSADTAKSMKSLPVRNNKLS